MFRSSFRFTQHTINMDNPTKAIKKQTTSNVINSCCVRRYEGASTGMEFVAFTINPSDQPTSVPFIYNVKKTNFYSSQQLPQIQMLLHKDSETNVVSTEKKKLADVPILYLAFLVISGSRK